MWTAMAMVLLTTTLTIATAGAYATNGGLKMGDPETELADYIAKCRAMHESHVAPTPMFAHAVAALADKLEEAEQSRDINHADAERYRWLRQKRYMFREGAVVTCDEQAETVALWVKCPVTNCICEVDAAIDADMKEQP